jgi:hypothetical protein
MKRHGMVKLFNTTMDNGDIGIFIGDSLCKEAYSCHRPGNLYLSSYDDVFSLGLGIAMNNDRRVFIFCDDTYLLKNMTDVFHIGVSKCKNIFIVIFISGTYSESIKNPTIFKSVRSIIGVLFNIGFSVHDYKLHFKNIRNPVKEIKSAWKNIIGPLIVVAEPENGIKLFSDFFPAEKESLLNIIDFIHDKKTIAYSYNSPVFTGGFNEENK